MAIQNNVIELVFKLKDQVSAPLASLRSKIGGLAAFGLGVAGIASFGAALTKTIAASREAQDVLLKFDIAFKNLGSASRKSRDELVKFADDASKVTIFDDEKILQAQTALLRFRSVSGQTFDRARQAALDMASAMGTDLVSAATLVGRAIERPELAIRQLRSAGVVFTQQQEKMIKSLVETGQKGKAAAIVLGELETRFKGAGDAAGKTLSGTLARLKTGFDNLFEVDTGPLTEGLEGLVKIVNDPKFREGIQALLGMMLKLVSYAARFAAFIGNAVQAITEAAGKAASLPGAAADSVRDFASSANPFRNAGMSGALTEDAIAATKFWDDLNAAADATIKDITSGIESIGKAVDEELVKKGKDFTAQFFNSSEKYKAAVAEADALLSAHVITQETYIRAVVAARDELEQLGHGILEVNQRYQELNPTLDQAIEKFNKLVNDDLAESIRKLTEPLDVIKADFTTGMDYLVDTFSNAMERMLNNGKFTWRTLGEYLLRELASGTLKKALDALRAAIKAATSGSSGNGIIAKGLNFIGSLLGGRAGGGDMPDGWTKVGENGPEWMRAPGARIYNANQMAGFGGRAAVIRGGDVNITVQGSMDERLAAAMADMVEIRLAQQSRETLRLMQRNGLKRPV